MKVLISMIGFGIGGTERALIGVLRAFNRKGVSVTLLLENTDIGNWKVEIPDNVNIRQLACKTLVANAVAGIKVPSYSRVRMMTLHSMMWLLIRILGHLHVPFSRRFDFSLQHCDDETEHYDLALDFYGYGNFATAYLAKKVKAYKKATWIHSITLTGCNRTADYLNLYDNIYCVSEATKQAFLNAYPQYSEKTVLLYNYLDVDHIHYLAAQEIDDPIFYGQRIIVSVGRLAPEKGYDISIKAAKILKDDGVSFRWFLIGEGVERKRLQDLISSLELEDTVVLLGAKSNPMPYIKKADLYVQSSRNEGFGLTVAEALVLEKTVIASNIKSFQEQIVDGENGYLVDNSPNAFFSCIRSCFYEEKKMPRINNTPKFSTLDDIFDIVSSIE